MSRTRGIMMALAAVGAALLLLGAADRIETKISDAKQFFEPLPAPPPLHGAAQIAQVELGKRLYFDKRLSAKQNQSCNSCHDLKTYGVDNKPFSPGTEGKLGGRNSPSVYNAALHVAQFWDGRAKDVEEQAGMPILNPVEMAMPSSEVVLARLARDPEYRRLFAKAFPGPNPALSYENLGKAIGAYERQLLTPSRFDAFLRGDDKALSAQEQAGMVAFVEVGCSNCHNGQTVGAQLFQKFGVHEDYWQETHSAKIDQGRIEQTKQDEDRYVFKVPSLRNVAKTGPYFHDGSVDALPRAVEVMAKVQLATQLTPEQRDQIVAFLGSLTGKPPVASKL